MAAIISVHNALIELPLYHISHSAAAATMAKEDKDNIWRDRQRQRLIATFLKNQLRDFRKTTLDSVSVCDRSPVSSFCFIRFQELLSSSPSMNHPRVHRFLGIDHPYNLFLMDSYFTSNTIFLVPLIFPFYNFFTLLHRSFSASGTGFLYFPIVLKPFSSIGCFDEDRRSELGFRNRSSQLERAECVQL